MILAAVPIEEEAARVLAAQLVLPSIALATAGRWPLATCHAAAEGNAGTTRVCKTCGKAATARASSARKAAPREAHHNPILPVQEDGLTILGSDTAASWIIVLGPYVAAVDSTCKRLTNAEKQRSSPQR